MDDRGKSDDPVVPAKSLNNAQGGAAEVVEGRGSAEGNAASETRSGPSAGTSAPSDLDRVRQAARKDNDVRFTALLHHVDVDRLRAAYWALREGRAGGGWRDVAGYGRTSRTTFGICTPGSIAARTGQGRRGECSSRRRNGRLRPLGVAALEDKILQRALVEVLNAIYETDFLGFSY